MNYFIGGSYNFCKEVFALAKKGRRKQKIIPVPEALIPEPHIEMLGNREVVVDGCKGVAEYSENVIKLNTGDFVVGFTGVDLLIKSFDCDAAVITGKIAEITFVS